MTGATPDGGARWLAGGACLLAAALVAGWLGLRPPAPRPASDPPGDFSADRALGRLGRLLGERGGEPHPVASAANRRLRERLLAELRGLGLEPEVQERFACGRYRLCAPVANVVARVPGRRGGGVVLLAAHYDSVPAGPGAADDGAGVAIALEVARALSAEPAERDVVLLLDDGEEAGLVGAEAFRASPLAREVGAVVNLEARGTCGPSVLFETAGPGGVVAGALASSANPPVASSLFAAVYRMFPNDTDLTALREPGVPGANLAFIGCAARYHTPRDDLAHLDPRSVQHQGQGALRLVRGLAASDLGHPAGSDPVFFDVMGWTLLRVPGQCALPAALAALALSIGAAALGVRRGLRPGQAALGLAALPLGIAVAVLAGFIAGRATGLDPLRRPWVADPGPLGASFLLCGLLAAAVPGVALARAGPAGLRSGVAVGLAAAATGLSGMLPGASYLLLAPALVAGAAGLAGAVRRGGGPAADLATALAAAAVLSSPAWLLYPAMGHLAGPAVASAVALAALPLAPEVAGLARRPRLLALAAPGLLAAAAVAWASLLAPADADSPEHLVVYFHQDADSGRARLLASSDLERLPEPVRASARFSAEARVPFGWAALRRAFEAEATPLPDPPPELRVEEVSRRGERLRVRATLSSPRGAPVGQLAVPPGTAVESLSFDGVAVPPVERRASRWFGTWSVYRHLALQREGTRVEMVLASPGPVDVQVADQSAGLPPEGARVAASRPPAAVTAQDGDVTLFTRTVRLDAR